MTLSKRISGWIAISFLKGNASGSSGSRQTTTKIAARCSKREAKTGLIGGLAGNSSSRGGRKGGSDGRIEALNTCAHLSLSTRNGG
jgi:hypothetical protein